MRDASRSADEYQVMLFLVRPIIMSLIAEQRGSPKDQDLLRIYVRGMKKREDTHNFSFFLCWLGNCGALINHLKSLNLIFSSFRNGWTMDLSDTT